MGAAIFVSIRYTAVYTKVNDTPNTQMCVQSKKINKMCAQKVIVLIIQTYQYNTGNNGIIFTVYLHLQTHPCIIYVIIQVVLPPLVWK